MHDNTVITVDANHVISASDQLFELMVIDFSSDLTGNYTCVATNDAGSVSSRTAVLELAGKLQHGLSSYVYSELVIVCHCSISSVSTNHY